MTAIWDQVMWAVWLTAGAVGSLGFWAALLLIRLPRRDRTGGQ